MTKSILKLSLLGLLAIAVVGTPVVILAQDAAATTPAPKKARALPFHGKVEAIDATAKTIMVGKETIQITSETKIVKAGKPATLADGAVGDQIGGSYRKDDAGKLNAISIRFGPKPEPAASTTKTNTP
jgi:hypothetical protein